MSSNDSVNYYLNDTSTSGDPWRIKEDWRIKYIRFASTSGSDTLFDDFSITVGTEEDQAGSGDVTSDPEITQFCFVDLDELDGNVYETYSIMEIPRYSGIGNRVIRGVDLYVDVDQRDEISSTMSDYELYIDDFYAGYPSEFVETGRSGILALRWDGFSYDPHDPLGCPLDGYIWLEFRCSAHADVDGYTSVNWLPMVKLDDYPLMPSDMDYRGHNQLDLLGNCQFDGETYWNRYNNLGEVFAGTCTYISDKPASTTCKYDSDALEGFPPKASYNEFETISLQFRLSTLTPQSYVQLWKDGVMYDSFYYGSTASGKPINKCQGEVTFLPRVGDAGSWSANIHRGGANITFFNFTVNAISGNDLKGQIATMPSNTEPNENFKIIWLYDKSFYDGLDGAIVYTYESSFTASNFFVLGGIKGNNTNGFDFDLPKTGRYYFWLCSDNNGVYTPITKTMHLVGSSGGVEPYITTDKYAYDLVDYEVLHNGQTGAEVFVSGVHNLGSSEVYVEINDGDIYKQLVDPSFSINLFLTQVGLYQADLVFYDPDNNQRYVLANTTFLVGEDIEAFYNEDVTSSPLPPIDPMIGGVMGAFVVVAFILAPIFIQVGAKRSFDTPPMLYAMLGISAVVLNVILGLFQLWVLYVIVVVGGIITVYTFLSRRGGG